MNKGKRNVYIALGLFVLSNLVGLSSALSVGSGGAGPGGDMGNTTMSNIIIVFFRVFLVMGISSEALKGEKWARWGVIILCGLTGAFGVLRYMAQFILGITPISTTLITLLNLIVLGIMLFQKDVVEFYLKDAKS